MREKLKNSTPTPAANAKVIEMTRESGYRADGGHVEKIKKAIHRKKRKHGGSVAGHKPAARLDKHARGGSANESEKIYHQQGRSETKSGSLPTKNVDSEAPGRARGGRRHHAAVNVVVHAGGSGEQEKKQAAQAGMQQGMKMGAMMGAKAALSHGAPPMAGGPPGGAPPMGAAPPMGGAVPPMGPGLGRKDGGKVETVKVREHTRRKHGGKVEDC